MKKLVFFTALVVLFIGSSCAQDIVNLRMNAPDQGLRGNVATLNEVVLVPKDYFREDWPTRKWFRQDLRNCLMEQRGRILTFDVSGRLTSVTYTLSGKSGNKMTCSYASNGLLTSYLGDGYKVEAKYKGTNADINIYSETKIYSNKVNLQYVDLASAPYLNTYPFDMKCRQRLSSDGRVLTSNYYYVDSLPARKCTYQYNHHNQLSEEQIMDFSSGSANPKSSTITYTYDNNDLLSQKTVQSTSVNDVYIYFNNEQGDCEKLTVDRLYGTEIYTYEYEYDDYGNWTMRLQFKNGSFDCATLRTITYYKNSEKHESKELARGYVYEEESVIDTSSNTEQSKKRGKSLFGFSKKQDKVDALNSAEKTSQQVGKNQSESTTKANSTKKSSVDTSNHSSASMPDEKGTNKSANVGKKVKADTPESVNGEKNAKAEKKRVGFFRKGNAVEKAKTEKKIKNKNKSKENPSQDQIPDELK